jgi:hypothetical protein
MTTPLELSVFATAMVFSVAGFVAGAALVTSGIRFGAGRFGPGALGHPLAVLGLLVVVAVGVVPHLYEELGFGGPALLALGFAAHRLYERTGAAQEHLASTLIVPILVLHSTLDGAALAVLARAGSGIAGAILSLPVAIHRVPEGMILAAALLPRTGARLTLAIAGAVGVTTVGGGVVGRALLNAVGQGALAAIVAAGVGVVMSAVTLRRVHAHV